MRKIILLWFILVPFFIFGQAISYTPKKTNTINKPFGIQITKNTQIFVEDSNALYKITANYNSTDSMTTVFRDHNFIKLCDFSIITANDTTGLDPTCLGLTIYSLSDNTIWQHSFVIDSITGDTTGCIWVDISTAKWKTNGLDLYYTAGNVGVGVIPNGSSKLEVKGTNNVGIKVNTTIGNASEINTTTGVAVKAGSVNGVTIQAEATGNGGAGNFSANYGNGLYSTSVYGYAAWLAGRVMVTDTLWVNGKIYAPHVATASTSDSIFGRDISGEVVLIPRSSGSGVITDSVPFVYNEPRHTIYPRDYSTARVTIGDNVTTADVNRKLHVAGSQYIQDTLFFGNYGDAIWTENEASFHMNNDLHIYGGLYTNFLYLSVLSDAAAPDSLLTIADGFVNRSSTTIFKDSIYRYSAYSSGNNNVEVLATMTGITATKSGGDITFTIPAHIRLISAKIRVESLSSVVCYLGTSDMANSSMANRWMPIVQAWREDTGVQLMGMTTSMSLTDFTKFTINGLIPTTICQIRLIF